MHVFCPVHETLRRLLIHQYEIFPQAGGDLVNLAYDCFEPLHACSYRGSWLFQQCLGQPHTLRCFVFTYPNLGFLEAPTLHHPLSRLLLLAFNPLALGLNGLRSVFELHRTLLPPLQKQRTTCLSQSKTRQRYREISPFHYNQSPPVSPTPKPAQLLRVLLLLLHGRGIMSIMILRSTPTSVRLLWTQTPHRTTSRSQTQSCFETAQ